MADTQVSFCVVNNIPKTYHAADLRNFFTEFLETKGFDCFHFRHRPELQVSKLPDKRDKISQSVAETKCCVVRVPTLRVNQFITTYAKKHWLDEEGGTLPTRCFIAKIKVTDSVSDDGEMRECYKTRAEQHEIPDTRVTFKKSDLHKLAEMHPPHIMPNGNVGTPTLVFLELIQNCRLPPKVISKLKLQFPKSRGKRKYGSVPFDYGTERVVNCSIASDECEISNIYVYGPAKSKQETGKAMEEVQDGDASDEDDDTGEEWDRHESLHNDVTQQGRVKERLYEEEIELQWEKGGSGLTFYTDAQYWDSQEGDFDERTTDDWDVDMSIYYEKGAGDKDARDFLQMRRECRLRNGEEKDGMFCNKGTSKIGAFEKHTRGVGRKIMEKRGWRDGDGLGSSVTGMALALENDGQLPSNKMGFGYHGQKLNRYVPQRKRRRGDSEVLIATVYDKLCDVEQKEPLLRSNPPTATKYRTTGFFVKSTEVLKK